MTTFASLFGGFGLADIGAQQAGCKLLWSLEMDREVADVAIQNGHPTICRSVLLADYRNLERPAILWASPPCLNFSKAKTGREETPMDKVLAQTIAEGIEILKPRVFILENVRDYLKSHSFARIIVPALAELGYLVTWQICNAADYGVPQTRHRLILRAVKNSLVPELPSPQKWVGWYQAIEDLLPNLQETEIPEWQRNLLPESLIKDFLCNGIANNYGLKKSLTVREADEPVMTITGSSGSKQCIRGVLLSRNQSDRDDHFRESQKPSYTVTTNSGGRTRAIVPERIVKLSSRCIARLQTLPDSYELPAKLSLAAKGIGNGVPCKFAKAIVQSVMGVAV